MLHITIPEDFGYPEVFEPVLFQFSDHYESIESKTTNLGSLFYIKIEKVVI